MGKTSKEMIKELDSIPIPIYGVKDYIIVKLKLKLAKLYIKVGNRYGIDIDDGYKKILDYFKQLGGKTI